MEEHNSETQRIKELLIRTYEGEAWHGPSVKKVLDTIDVTTAAQRLPGSHNIIELVRHMVIWRQFAIARLEGDDDYDVIADENWTHISELQAFAWLEAVENLEKSQECLIALLDQMSDDRLCETVAGRPYSYYVLLHGIIQHDLYHLGQIVLLNKPQLSIPMPEQAI